MPEIRRHTQQKPNRFRAFLSQYRFEIIWLAVVALGVFLVFERMNIRSNVLRWMRNTATALFRGIGHLDEHISAFLARTTVSDAIGYVLILGALVALVLRFRWRLLHNPQLTTLECPKCGSAIHRVHRKRIDHLISTFVPVRRYRCAKRECGWRGTRINAAKAVPSSRFTATRD